jgi:ankyrin repeat protein
MQIRALGGRRGEIAVVSTWFTAMLPEMDAFTLIHSTALVDHPGLHDEIKGLLPISTPKYIMHQVAGAGLLNYAAQFIQGHKVGERDTQNKTPLHHAAMNSHREMCCYLLKHGADAAAKDDEGRTALHCAAMGGNEAVVRLLLEDYKADAGAKTDEGRTALHYAAKGGNEAVVRLLLEDYKADAAAAKDGKGRTVLHYAAMGGNEAVVRLLLEDYKANAAAKDGKGRTALHYAAKGGHDAVVRVLKLVEQAQ